MALPIKKQLLWLKALAFHKEEEVQQPKDPIELDLRGVLGATSFAEDLVKISLHRRSRKRTSQPSEASSTSCWGTKISKS